MLFKINDQHVVKFLTYGRIDTWGITTICNQFEFLVLYVPHTVLSVTLLQASSGTVFNDSAMAGKNSLTALLATELGIRCTKRLSSLGKAL